MQIKIEGKPPIETKYPCLKEYSGVIVLFVSEKTGMALTGRDIEFRGDWIEQSFKFFNGKLTIET